MTLGLVVTRPRLSPGLRLSPAMAAFAGIFVLFALGIIRPGHVAAAVTDLWSPFVAIASIMVMTEVANEVGLLEWWAARVEARAETTTQLFMLVFGLGVMTSATLNNDAAILLLTPLVITLVRRRYPDRPELLVPFAFAVFMSAGVAALPVSNPMNMVVADVSGIGFNTYVLHMIPVAIVGWLIAFAILRWRFATSLRTELSAANKSELRAASSVQRRMMLLLAIVLVSYPLIGYFGGPIWIVALAGGVAAALLGARHKGVQPLSVIRYGVSWETLAFLLAVLIMAMGLLEVGLVDRLVDLYDGSGVATVGITSTVGSAVLNNHPMAYLNMMALQGSTSGDLGVFAALIGGDLGPRLLPMGSLAGLLWLEMLRRQGVRISLRQFATNGALVTIPAVLASLALLALM